MNTAPPHDPGSPTGVPQPDLTPPPPVRLAVRLMMIGAAVSAVSALVSLATYGSFEARLAEQMRAADPAITDDLVETAVAVGITFAVAMGLLGAAVWWWMARKNRQGRAWARVIASTLTGLNALFFVVGLVGEQYDALALALSAILLALAVAAMALVWTKESSAFYDAASNSHTL